VNVRCAGKGALSCDWKSQLHRRKTIVSSDFSVTDLTVEIIESDVGRKGKKARTQALAAAALYVGGMVLACSIDDRGMADGPRKAALALGAWS
jgi:hypothetical protein